VNRGDADIRVNVCATREQVEKAIPAQAIHTREGCAHFNLPCCAFWL
jgi:hypothetical protein